MKVDNRWKFSAVIASDVLFTAFSYWLAYFLRFNFSIPEVFSQKMIETLPVVLLVKISCYYFFGLYRGIWRYASMNDLARILKAATLSSILFGLYVVLRHRFIDFPRSVLIIDWLVIVACLGGSRFLYRFFREFHGQKRSGDNRVLIIGADDTGEMLLREMRQNRKADYTPVGFLDKEPGKMGKYIHSVPILGGIEELDAVTAEKQIHEVIVASPSITGREMRKIVETCDRAGVRCKTVPPIGDILNGKVNVSQIREISIEDLLGRERIELDAEKIRQYLSGKKVMVTGAAGSIGRELCRQILKIGPKQLILFERAENELFYLDLEFAKRSLNGLYEPVLGDVLDVGRLEWAMREFRPDVVFHAAAYKHVPMQEAHPVEAIKNNIIGTRNVAEMSIKYDVEKFVMISTDKAVKPASVMGATKRIAEVICQEMNRRNRTKFVVVRFGNVLNSAGSVIPIFKEQILKGGPVTVTHPEATRYFMSIPEAAQLVMQAGAIGVGGEILVLDMGEPIKIIDLARDMVRLMGLKVGEDIDIVYSGLRPGEKLHEKLITDEEKMEPTIHEKIMLVRSANHNWKLLENRLTGLIAGVNESNTTHIKEELLDLIPECSPKQTS